MRRWTAFFTILFLGVVAGSFAVLSRNGGSPARDFLAQVGIVVGVAPNPYNTLDAALNQKQAQIDQQAANLAAREAAFASTTSSLGFSSSILITLSVAVALLALLVLFNFYLDFRRARRERRRQSTAPRSDDISEDSV